MRARNRPAFGARGDEARRPTGLADSGLVVAGLGLSVMLMPILLSIAIFGIGGSPGARALGAGLGVMWALAAAAYVLARGLLLDIGLRRPDRGEWIVAIVLGVALMLLVPVLTLVSAALMPHSGLGSRGSLGLVVAGVVTAAVTEEVIFRGVGITSLEKAGIPTWVAAAISLIAFALVHVATWPFAHVVFVALPLGAALTWCYRRYRNLWVVMVAHAVVDAPLIVFSLEG